MKIDDFEIGVRTHSSESRAASDWIEHLSGKKTNYFKCTDYSCRVCPLSQRESMGVRRTERSNLFVDVGLFVSLCRWKKSFLPKVRLNKREKTQSCTKNKQTNKRSSTSNRDENRRRQSAEQIVDGLGRVHANKWNKLTIRKRAKRLTVGCWASFQKLPSWLLIDADGK